MLGLYGIVSYCIPIPCHILSFCLRFDHVFFTSLGSHLRNLTGLRVTTAMKQLAERLLERQELSKVETCFVATE